VQYGLSVPVDVGECCDGVERPLEVAQEEVPVHEGGAGGGAGIEGGAGAGGSGGSVLLSPTDTCDTELAGVESGGSPACRVTPPTDEVMPVRSAEGWRRGARGEAAGSP